MRARSVVHVGAVQRESSSLLGSRSANESATILCARRVRQIDIEESAWSLRTRLVEFVHGRSRYIVRVQRHVRSLRTGVDDDAQVHAETDVKVDVFAVAKVPRVVRWQAAGVQEAKVCANDVDITMGSL